MALALLAGSFVNAGCEAILGLGGETAAEDAGARRDAPSDAVEAGEPPGAAVVVASNNVATNWCAVTAGGDVECWGNNESGELGDGTTTSSMTPVKVRALPGPAASVTTGVATVCALLRSGGVYCWGLGQDGELGNGTMSQLSSTAVAVHGLGSDVTSVSAGYGVGCAVKAGAVLCWGSGQVGLLGTDETNDALVPTPVPGLTSGVTSVSVGDSSACAVRDGAVLCWGGFDGHGELGNGTTSGSNEPVAVKGLPGGVTAVSVGVDFACALTKAGGVMCWGDGTSGTLGNGQLAVSPVPVQVQGLTRGVVAVSAGGDSSSAIRADGSVVTWGYAADGALGNGSAEPDSGIGGGAGGASSVPVAVKGLSGPAVSISTGQAPCVATTAGRVECWGITGESALVPVHVTALDQVKSVTAGGILSTGVFACAVEKVGAISCWGGNGAGQLGNGTNTSSAVPVLNAGVVEGATAVSAGNGGDFACGIASGIAYCWGNNDTGQLGNGTSVASSMPVAVQGLTTVTSLAAGGASACAIAAASPDAGAGGALYCWGDNRYGQLGDGTTTSSQVPVPVTGLTGGVVAVSAGVYSACAVLSDGTVDCWGENEMGQLGDGTEKTRLVPTKVVGMAAATSVSAGWYSTCAVMASGTIQCWGDNTFGELGDDSLTSSLTPVAVMGVPFGATQVSVGNTTACAVVGGGAQCWGFGAIGNGGSPALHYLFPAPVTGLTGVTSVATGDGFACAAAHGAAECWGINSIGELGNGGALDTFLPNPVPGFP
jgi:alpha-tubulin suppressor-like RCC1 family protein